MNQTKCTELPMSFEKKKIFSNVSYAVMNVFLNNTSHFHTGWFKIQTVKGLAGKILENSSQNHRPNVSYSYIFVILGVKVWKFK